VAIRGETAVIGAYRDDDSGTDAGAAYVFTLEETSLIDETKLLASDGQVRDWFGNKVAVDGERICVAAVREDASGEDSGSIYVFHRSGDEWIETKIVPSDGSAMDKFGIDVEVDGDLILVGAYADGPGSAYLFAWSNDEWLETKLLASDGVVDDWFGHSVAIDDPVAVVGADGRDEQGSESGAAYVFEGLSGPDCNGNGSADFCDIFTGQSDDGNANGIPDECEPCMAADIDGDAVVDVSDFLILLAQWGPCPPVCIADIDGDGAVGVLDFLLLLANWGPCP
jgi:hypothetical protein